MASHKNDFKLGLAMLLFVGLAVATLLFIAGGLPSSMEEFVVRFPATELTARLKEGGEVVCGGQEVGVIRSIAMKNVQNDQHGEDLYVYITAGVSAGVGLRQDARIVPGEPLLGEVSKLVIRDRGVGKPVDAKQPLEGERASTLSTAIDMVTRELDVRNKEGLLALLKSELKPGDASSLLGKIHRSLDDLNMVTRNVSVQLNPQEQNVLIAKVHAVLDNINAATAALRQQVDPSQSEAAMTKVHAALDSLNKALATTVAMMEENRPVIRDTLVDVRHTAQTLDEKIASRIAQELDVGQAASLLAKIHSGIAKMDRSLKDINEITGMSRDMFVAKQGEIDKIFTNFLETSEYLKAAVKDLWRSPWRLLYKPSEQEQKQLSVFDAARAFADAATRLDNASIRIKGMIEARGGTIRADDPELIAIRDSLQHTFEQFSAAEKALWNQLKIR